MVGEDDCDSVPETDTVCVREAGTLRDTVPVTLPVGLPDSEPVPDTDSVPLRDSVPLPLRLGLTVPLTDATRDGLGEPEPENEPDSDGVTLVLPVDDAAPDCDGLSDGEPDSVGEPLCDRETTAVMVGVEPLVSVSDGDGERLSVGVSWPVGLSEPLSETVTVRLTVPLTDTDGVPVRDTDHVVDGVLVIV